MNLGCIIVKKINAELGLKNKKMQLFNLIEMQPHDGPKLGVRGFLNKGGEPKKVGKNKKGGVQTPLRTMAAIFYLNPIRNKLLTSTKL